MPQPCHDAGKEKNVGWRFLEAALQAQGWLAAGRNVPVFQALPEVQALKPGPRGVPRVLGVGGQVPECGLRLLPMQSRQVGHKNL